MGTSTPGKLLVAGRVLIGGGAFVVPVPALRLGGLRPRRNPQAAYMLQLFAVRDAMLGVGLVASSGAARRTWWKAGIACDLADAAAALVETAAGRVPRNGRTGFMLIASPLLGAALGAAALAAEEE
ncbi:MAG TPA: hypothetical protein VGI72_03365 [Gaiellales bacterium]